MKSLIASKMTIELNNGVSVCKNCGVDFNGIIDTLSKVIITESSISLEEFKKQREKM